MHLFCDISTGRSRPLVPPLLRKTVFNQFHGLNHPGTKPTIKKVEDRYYWPELRQDVSKWTNECLVCLKCKYHKTIRPAVSHIPVVPRRFTQLQFDLVGPLVPSSGYRYLFTVICRTSRWIEAFPLTDATSQACVDAIIQGWIPRFGLPCQAISDNGPSFVSNIWKGLHDSLGTIVSYTPPLHPQSLGSLERQHADIKSGLRSALLSMNDSYGASWLTALPWILLGRRTDLFDNSNHKKLKKCS